MRENDLLQHIYRFNSELDSRVTVPPGDDMGAVRIGKRDVLITVDQLADGVHFRLGDTPLEKIARKAITRNLSDVAAMAALPVGAVVAGCLPRDFGEATANALFDAMRSTAQSFDCPLIGGDISVWDQSLVLTVTILAETARIDPVLRSGAQPGDLVFVSGHLGGSLESVAPNGYVHHLDFAPRISLARQLAEKPDTRPRCMMDLSDGLATDLPRIIQSAARPCSAILDTEQIPQSQGCVQAGQRTGQPTWYHAMADGEDYELCMIFAPEQAQKLPAYLDGIPLTKIGEVVEESESEIILRHPGGGLEPCRISGWEHHD